MTNTIPANAVLAAIAITVIALAAVITLAMSVTRRKGTTQDSSSQKSEARPPHLYVLTNTDGQICHMQGRPVITGDIDEARYLQAGLMENATMTVINVYTPERII